MLAEETTAAGDCERYNHFVAHLEILHRRANLDYLAHELMAKNVAGFERWHICVVEMEVRTADRSASDLDDGIARIQDFRIGNGINTDVFFSIPAECFHATTSSRRCCDCGRTFSTGFGRLSV